MECLYTTLTDQEFDDNFCRFAEYFPEARCSSRPTVIGFANRIAIIDLALDFQLKRLKNMEAFSCFLLSTWRTAATFPISWKSIALKPA